MRSGDHVPKKRRFFLRPCRVIPRGWWRVQKVYLLDPLDRGEMPKKLLLISLAFSARPCYPDRPKVGGPKSILLGPPINILFSQDFLQKKRVSRWKVTACFSWIFFAPISGVSPLFSRDFRMAEARGAFFAQKSGFLDGFFCQCQCLLGLTVSNIAQIYESANPAAPPPLQPGDSPA